MIATLIRKTNYCYCSECRMKQPTILEPYCFFCGATFSNYEEELTKAFKESEDNNLG